MEVKKQRKDLKFRMCFDDMLQAISDKVRTMKAQGVTLQKDGAQSANVVSLESNKPNDLWKRKAASPPKPTSSQETKVECFYCNASHPLDKCNALLNLSLVERIEILKMAGVCFKCLKAAGHIARFCEDNGFKCNSCHLSHPTILCGQRQWMQKHQQKLNGNPETSDGCHSNNQIDNDDSRGNIKSPSSNLHADTESNSDPEKESVSVDDLTLIPNVNTS